MIWTSTLRQNQKLKHLRELSICNTKVRDISPLNSNNKWEVLALGGLDITDLDILDYGLFKLKVLVLDNNNIADINKLKLFRFNSISQLDLSGNLIEDVTPLGNAELYNLKYLKLGKNKISNVRPLLNLPSPQSVTIDLMGNPLTFEECENQVGKNQRICSSLSSLTQTPIRSLKLRNNMRMQYLRHH